MSVFISGFRMSMKLPCVCSASTLFAEARVHGFNVTIRKKCLAAQKTADSSTNTILLIMPDRYDLPIMKSFMRALIE